MRILFSYCNLVKQKGRLRLFNLFSVKHCIDCAENAYNSGIVAALFQQVFAYK